MKPLLAALLLLAAVAPPVAGDGRGVNRLTPREIADGWILLFDGKTTTGWTHIGDVKVADRKLVMGGDQTSGIATTSFFSYYTLRFQFRLPCGESIVVLNQQRWKFHNWLGGEPEIRKLRDADGWVQSEWHLLPNPDGIESTHEMRGSFGSGKAARTFGAGQALSWNRGIVGFRVPPGDSLTIRSIKLKPEQLKPLFNGKDLAGWKATSGNKAKIAINDKRELQINGGPGGVQTVADYGDFIMQAEVRGTGPDPILLNIRGQELRVGTDWTAVTIAICGDHVAAWVDGRQKLDAKLKDPGKEPITILGTEVAVRNVRVGELPGPEKK